MEDNSEILDISSHTKAAGLLLSKISSTLDAGITKTFYKFLDIVDQHGSSDSKTVANAIRKKLKSTIKGIYQRYTHTTSIKSRLTIVSREAKKKQHACSSSGPRHHYSELFTRMAALKF